MGRAPKPAVCEDDEQCDHVIIFGLHYDRVMWEEFVEMEKAERDANIPGAGPCLVCNVQVRGRRGWSSVRSR